ncbi:hypothetical protein Tco_0494206 [Tanacetum coccineum]
MEHENQQVAQDEALVPIDDQVKIGSCNMRIDPLKKQKEPTYQLSLDIIKQYSCYNAFLKTTDVPQIYMQQFWYTIAKNQIHHVLGRLKFISKGEKDQKNGMSIPDTMMNAEIKESDHYMAYLTLSTNVEENVPKVVKGKGKELLGKKKADASVLKEKKKDVMKKKDARKKKDVVPRKKRSITADDNILPDPDEALKLDSAESEETEDDEVQPLIRRSTSVVIGREIPKRLAKEALDHSQKLKGIETIQQQFQGSSEGAGIIQEVPDEPKDISVKADQNKPDEEKADEEMKDAEKFESKKTIEEHADDEKAEEEKIEEEKAEDEQVRNDQAHDEQAKDDQAGVIIPKIQQEKPEVPPTSSSLTMSSAEYSNQFLSVSSNTSLAGILKEPAEIEIQSMVDTTPTPSTTPPTIDAQVTPASVSDSSPTFLQRLSELEKKVEALMESTVRDVLQKTPIYLAQPFSTPAESLTKYELQKILLDKM